MIDLFNSLSEKSQVTFINSLLVVGSGVVISTVGYMIKKWLESPASDSQV